MRKFLAYTLALAIVCPNAQSAFWFMHEADVPDAAALQMASKGTPDPVITAYVNDAYEPIKKKYDCELGCVDRDKAAHPQDASCREQ